MIIDGTNGLTFNNATTQASAGVILQVVQGYTSASFTTTSGTATDITGMTATITPKFSTSKILVMTVMNHAEDSSTPYPKLFLQRNGTNIGLGDAIGSAVQVSTGAYAGGAVDSVLYPATMMYLDSPATTSAVTYKWQVYTFSSRTFYLNRTGTTGDTNRTSASSSITLMEIAA